MKALICDLCNGPLTIEAGGEFAVCEYCGVKYSMERLRQKVQAVTGTVEVVTGSAELERLCENAETLLRLGEYKRALDVFTDLTKLFPGDWRGWWGIVRLTFITHELNIFSYIPTADAAEPRPLKNVCTLCPDMEIVRGFIREFWQTRGTKARALPLEEINRSLYGDSSYDDARRPVSPLAPDAKYTFDSFTYYFTMPQTADSWCRLLDDPEITAAFHALREDLVGRLMRGELIPPSRPIAETLTQVHPELREVRQLWDKALSATDGRMIAALLRKNGYAPALTPQSTDPECRKYRPMLTISGSSCLGIISGAPFVCGGMLYMDTNEPYGNAYSYNFYLAHPANAVLFRELDSQVTAEHRIAQGLCRHCGGEFRGLFRQKCEKCGKPKDY